MEIQTIIKNRRTELGLTMKDVAKALDVSEATISRYESSAIQNMGIDKIEPLAKVLRCSPGYLMGWEDTPAATSAYEISEEEYRLIVAYRKADTFDKMTVIRALHLGEKEECFIS